MLLIITHVRSNSFSNFHSTLYIFYHSISSLELLVLQYQLELHVTLTKNHCKAVHGDTKEQELQKVLFCIRKGSTYYSASDTSLNYILLLLQAATKLANLTASEISVMVCVFFTCKVVFQGWIPFFAFLTEPASGSPVVFIFLDHLSKGLPVDDWLFGSGQTHGV